MDSNRNTVLQVIVPRVAFAVVLSCGLAGCKMGAETKATQEPAETQAQPQANEKVARLEKENAELRQEVAKLEEILVGVASGRLPSREFWNLPAIEADVRKVDRKRRRVTLRIYRGENADVGMRFHVARHDAYVGEVMVIEVRPDQCIAVILRLKQGMNIEVGDYAATRI